MLGDVRFETMLSRIREVIHDDTHYQKGTLNMRAQKCFAVKVGAGGWGVGEMFMFMSMWDINAYVSCAVLDHTPFHSPTSMVSGFAGVLYKSIHQLLLSTEHILCIGFLDVARRTYSETIDDIAGELFSTILVFVFSMTLACVK